MENQVKTNDANSQANNAGGGSNNNLASDSTFTELRLNGFPHPVPLGHGNDSGPSEYIENIADHLAPKEVWKFLFQGHEREHVAVAYLPQDVGKLRAAQGSESSDDASSDESIQEPDTRKCCLFCHRNVMRDVGHINTRVCGHHFHVSCFNAQPRFVQEIHLKNLECNFCILDTSGHRM